MLTINEIRKRITPICQRYMIQSAYLFGSYARGDANERSDIDIRIEKGNHSKLIGLFSVSGFRLELIDALGKDVDLMTCIPKDNSSKLFRLSVSGKSFFSQVQYNGISEKCKEISALFIELLQFSE